MIEFLQGDALTVMKTMESESFQCCVTSPPYWGLRDYGVTGAFGLEETPEAYVANIVAAFREVWRVLREDGTLWLNLGDSYTTSNPVGRRDKKYPYDELAGSYSLNVRKNLWRPSNPNKNGGNSNRNGAGPVEGLKAKNLVGIPWRVAFALQTDGWYLRSDIIWHKRNPMPESVTDRPTKAHEYIFLLSKSERYFYDAGAIRERSSEREVFGNSNGKVQFNYDRRDGNSRNLMISEYRNRQTVWTFATQPYAEAHFATFPEEIPKLCILAGSKTGDRILDPFAGSGTTGQVALELGRRAVLIELNPAYIELARSRCNVTPGFPNF